jgi:hypothetical protein
MFLIIKGLLRPCDCILVISKGLFTAKLESMTYSGVNRKDGTKTRTAAQMARRLSAFKTVSGVAI